MTSSESLTISYDVGIEAGNLMKWVLANTATDEEFELTGEGAIEASGNVSGNLFKKARL